MASGRPLVSASVVTHSNPRSPTSRPSNPARTAGWSSTTSTRMSRLRGGVGVVALTMSMVASRRTSGHGYRRASRRRPPTDRCAMCPTRGTTRGPAPSTAKPIDCGSARVSGIRIADQLGDDDRVVVLLIACGVDDRDGTAPCATSQLEDVIAPVGELATVSRAKLIEPGGVMGEPAAKVVARRELARPLVEARALARDATWPHVVDEDAVAVARIGVVVDALDAHVDHAVSSSLVHVDLAAAIPVDAGCTRDSLPSLSNRDNSATPRAYTGRSSRRRAAMLSTRRPAFGGSRRDQAAPNGVPRELDAVAHAELLQHVGPVAVDRLAADHQEVRDLVAGVAFGDKLEHLELAGREWIHVVSAAGAIEVVAHERGHGAGVEERLTAHRGPARMDEVAVGRRLQHVAGGAGAQRLEQELLVLVHREHERPHLSAPAREFARGLQAGHARHGDVEDREVDVVLEGALHRLRAVADLVDDPEVGLGVEQVAQAVEHDRVVVREKHSGDQRDAHTTSLPGRCRRTSVPPSRAGPIAMFAPTSSARSRIPRRPLDSRSTFAGRPTPSSRTTSSTPSPSPSPSRRSVTSIRLAPAWRTTLVMLSCATRWMTSSCSAVSGRSRSRLRVIGIPARSETAVHSASSALCSPSSSSASGRRRWAIIRTSCAPRRAASRSSSRSPRSSVGARRESVSLRSTKPVRT